MKMIPYLSVMMRESVIMKFYSIIAIMRIAFYTVEDIKKHFKHDLGLSMPRSAIIFTVIRSAQIIYERKINIFIYSS